MSELFFIIIICILAADYLLESWLDYLNARYRSEELPNELKGIYDEEKYRKQQAYEKANKRLGMITRSLNLLIILTMLIFGFFGYLDSYIRELSSNTIIIALLFFGSLGLGASLIFIPFDAFDTFVIEERFGFNKTTVKTFIFDIIKGWLLAAVIGAVLLSAIIWIYESTGTWFWFYAWLVISFFSVFITMFYSNLIVPLFNKQKTLEAGELRDEIEAFSKKAGFKLKNIFVIDGSKRSTKANAYFAGLGSKKRIVLYDTLIKQHTKEELVAVLAHEIGHYKMKHTTLSVTLSIIQTGIMLYILSLFIAKDSALSIALCTALNAEQSSFHIGILGFGIIYSPLSLIIGLAMNILSRKNEYAADRFAGENYKPDALKAALIKLSVNNLSNLRPHPAYVFFHYSHPTLLQRIKELDKCSEKTSIH
ncbi:MAG: M48 family metallopeptidase [Bacteroidales bacterium]|nr:M48 family metallopeptidase [Bacteroidales bacterium]